MAPPNDKYTTEDDGPDRAAILSRRTFLVEAALVPAGLGLVAGCKDKSQPQVCLNVRSVEPDAGATTNPADASADSPAVPIPADRPKVCLNIAPPPRPKAPVVVPIPEAPND